LTQAVVVDSVDKQAVFRFAGRQDRPAVAAAQQRLARVHAEAAARLRLRTVALVAAGDEYGANLLLEERSRGGVGHRFAGAGLPADGEQRQGQGGETEQRKGAGSHEYLVASRARGGG
jgi:hypothetical protein